MQGGREAIGREGGREGGKEGWIGGMERKYGEEARVGREGGGRERRRRRRKVDRKKYSITYM